MGCNLAVGLGKIRRHVLQRRLAQPLPELGTEVVVPRHARDEHQPSHPLRVANRHLHGDAGAVAEAQEVRLRHVQEGEQRGGVVGRPLERERPIRVGGAAVTLLVERDDPVGSRQPRQNLRPGGLDGRVSTVQEDERRAARGTVHLVVDPQPAYRRVAARDGRGRQIGGRRELGPGRRAGLYKGRGNVWRCHAESNTEQTAGRP